MSGTAYDPTLSTLGIPDGLAGWDVLQGQTAANYPALTSDPVVTREIAYFEANAPKATTAAALMADPRLQNFALTAYGLTSESGMTALMTKVLNSDPTSTTSFAAQMSNAQFTQIATAFNYGGGSGNTDSGDAVIGRGRYQQSVSVQRLRHVQRHFRRRDVEQFEPDGRHDLARSGGKPAVGLSTRGRQPLRHLGHAEGIEPDVQRRRGPWNRNGLRVDSESGQHRQRHDDGSDRIGPGQSRRWRNRCRGSGGRQSGDRIQWRGDRGRSGSRKHLRSVQRHRRRRFGQQYRSVRRHHRAADLLLVADGVSQRRRGR